MSFPPTTSRKPSPIDIDLAEILTPEEIEQFRAQAALAGSAGVKEHFLKFCAEAVSRDLLLASISRAAGRAVSENPKDQSSS